MAIEFYGLCGANSNVPCKLSYSTSFRPYRVGVYPSEYLPAKMTIWYASSMYIGSFQKPVISPGDFGVIGAGLLGGFVATGMLSFQSAIWNTPSFYSFIWAKTVNHINTVYTIKSEDLLASNTEGEITDLHHYIKISVSDYLFDVLCVVDDPQPITDAVDALKEKYYSTTDEEVEPDIYKRSQDDQFTQALFSMEMPQDASGEPLLNRFQHISPNRLGIEYRLDNAREYSTPIMNSKQADLLSPTYNDASSKELIVDVGPEYTDASGNKRKIQAGDKLYITYLGVPSGGHIMRQHIFARWSGFATSLPPSAGCMGAMVLEVSHFKFFTWDLEKENPNDPNEVKKQLSGWRVVETFNCKPNFIYLIPGTNTVIGDFARGNQTGHVEMKVLDGNISYPKLVQFLEGDAKERSLYAQFDDVWGNTQYHPSASKSDVAQAKWAAGFYSYDSYERQISHLIFNVHPKALRRRDVDKWGIPRSMADSIQKALASGQQTFVPFMDNPYLTDPLSQVASQDNADKYLNAGNFATNPIKRVSQYGGNAQCTANSMGGIATGNWGADNYAAGLVFVSNIISEVMPKETKILIEQFFTAGSRGPEILSISATLGGSVKGLSCILDPARTLMFVFFPRNELLAYHKLKTGPVELALSSLEYRPEVHIKIEDPNNPVLVKDGYALYEPVIGYSGLAGDTPGFSHGNLVNAAFFADDDAFEYVVSDHENSIYNDKPASKITGATISITLDGDSSKAEIILPLEHYGFTTITYLIPDADVSTGDILLVFKNGDTVASVIDGVALSIGIPNITTVEHPWVLADKLELVGPVIGMIEKLQVDMQSMKDDFARDFLDGRAKSDGELKDADTRQVTTWPVFFSSTMMSVAEDPHSNLFVFFQDKRDGVSVAISPNFCNTWSYQFGIVEKVGDNPCTSPFVLQKPLADKAFLFYMMRQKVFCKALDFSLFAVEDEMRVVTYEEDILKRQPAKVDGQDVESTEKTGWYTDKGRGLRVETSSYLAAGSIFDDEFQESRQTEWRTVEQTDTSGAVITSVVEVKKYSFDIDVSTSFVYKPVEDPYISAYRRDQGEMVLVFLGKISNGRSRIQCHFSPADGQNWCDMFEYMSYSTSRMKINTSPGTSGFFIDRDNKYSDQQTGGAGPTDSEESYIYGINLHKQGKQSDVEEEDISSPYVYYHPDTEYVFLFYVFKNCLFCKRFQDSLFQGSYEDFKKAVENSPSDFVDGWIKDTDLEEEIGKTFVFQWSETKAQLVSKNPNVQTTNDNGSAWSAVDTFDDTRAIDAQRVAACEVPTGVVKVYYSSKTGTVRSATYKSPYWAIDDLMRSEANVGFEK